MVKITKYVKYFDYKGQKMYCTYVTTYLGNKMPMFYIGYSTIKRIKNGYRGSVCSIKYKDIWNTELKENPHLFNTKILKTFNSRSAAKSHEYKLQLKLNVHKNPLYLNLNINGEKFFIKYKGKNNPMFGKNHSEKTKIKISEALRGKLIKEKNPMFGKTHSKKVKQLLSEHSKQKWTQELKQKMIKNKIKGTYITPWGNFYSTKEAIKHPDCFVKDYGTLRDYCKNCHKLRRGKSFIKGKTPFELGFCFLPEI